MSTEKQIERLIREVRIYRLASFSLLLAVIAAFLIAAKNAKVDSFDVITANRLIIREEIDFVDASNGRWGDISQIGPGITKVAFYSLGPNRNSMELNLFPYSSSLSLKAENHQMNLMAMAQQDDDPGESSITLLTANQPTREEILNLSPLSPDSFAMAWEKLEDRKVFLELTDYTGIEDIEIGGAIMIFNKEGKRVFDAYPNAYGNGRLGLYTKKGPGREFTSE